MFNRLQYISQGVTPTEQLANITRVLDSGGQWIQLRFKEVDENTLMTLAEQIKRLCESYKATFIVNDWVSIAKDIDADGVHLGLTDGDVLNARIVLGVNKIIGGTANTLEHVLQRIDQKCDYVGLGPYAYTTTKEKLSPILGIEGYRLITQQLQVRGLTIPVFAIGGIHESDVFEIRKAGLYGVAVSGLLQAETTLLQKKIKQLNYLLYDNA